MSVCLVLAPGGERAAAAFGMSGATTASSAYNLRVFVRVRPPLPREPQEVALRVSGVQSDGTQVVNVVPVGQGDDRRRAAVIKAFAFDGVFAPSSTQDTVYSRAVESQVAACLQGFNSTVFCYGPSGSGKSFTCYGPAGAAGTGGIAAAAHWAASPEAGIIPRSAQQLFDAIEQGGADMQHGRFLLRVSFVQLYRESLSDLLAPECGALSVREDPHKGVFVEGVTEVAVRTPQDVWALAARGQRARTTAATRINDVSSRSHALFTVVLEQVITPGSGGDGGGGATARTPRPPSPPPTTAEEGSALKMSRLNLVDLAGSEAHRHVARTAVPRHSLPNPLHKISTRHHPTP